MKRAHAVLILLAITGLLLSPILAAGATDTPKSRNAKKPTTSPAAAKTVHGELTGLNVETGVLTVHQLLRKQQSEDVTLTTNDKTEFVIDHVGVTLADLKLGMTLRATLDSSGIVTKIDAQPLTKQQQKKRSETTRSASTTTR